MCYEFIVTKGGLFWGRGFHDVAVPMSKFWPDSVIVTDKAYRVLGKRGLNEIVKLNASGEYGEIPNLTCKVNDSMVLHQRGVMHDQYNFCNWLELFD